MKLQPTTPLTLAAVAAMSLTLLASGCKTGNYDEPAGGGVPLTATDGAGEGAAAGSGLEGLGYADAGPAAAGAETTTVTMAFPTGDRATSAVLLEKETPAEVVLGTNYDYRITVSNLTERALESVVVEETVPAGFALGGTEPQASVAAGRATWDLGVLAPRSRKTLVVSGKAVDMKAITSCATVSYESKLCSTTNVVSPSLAVTLEAPAEGLSSEPIDVKVTVTNQGTGDARGVRVTQDLPDGLTNLAGMRRVVMEFGDLAGAQSKQKTVKLKASAAGVYVHTATAEAAGGLTSSAPEVSTVLREPSLALSVTAPEKVFVTRPMQTTLRVANTGDAASEDTVVRVALPADVTVSEAEGGAINADAVTWRLGTIEPGESRDLAYTASARMGGLMVVEARATGRGAEEAVATARTEVTGVSALLLQVADESDLILVGEPVTYDIEITNQGSAPDTKIVVNADVEDGVEITGTQGPVTGVISGRTVTFEPIETLAPGEKVVLKVTVKSSKQFDSRFRVRLTSTEKTRPVVAEEATNFLN